MRLCLSCYHLSPSDAIFCGKCARSFGGRICHSKKHHLSPMSAHVCVQCGSSDLSDPTFFLSFGCLTRLITWGLVLLALWKLTPLATRVTGITAEKVISQTSIVPIIEICWRLFIFGLICYWVLSWVLSTLPGEPGKQLRNLVLGTLNFFIKQGWRWLQILAKGAFHLLRSLVEGDNRTKH